VKLFFSSTSPFVRKVMACAIARGIEEQIETIRSNPHESPPDLLRANPLSKVPCLLTDNGMALFDSPLICEYLDSLGSAAKLFPPAGPTRWQALKQQALGDGILDAAVGRRGEMAKPPEAGRQAWMARQKAAIDRSVDQLESDLPQDGLDIGTITLACALGYLDFRFGAEPWRGAHPRLADWFAKIAKHPAIARTAPKEG
jgi:glutathione S-transferase